MADYTGAEWQGEPLAYGTIVTAPSHGIVAMVLTGKEGAMPTNWYPLRAGEHAILVLDAGPYVFGRTGDDKPNIVWMLDYDRETLRWFVR